MAAELETLIQLCELENPAFQRQPPAWNLRFNDSSVQRYERGQTRGRHDLAAFFLSLSSIIGTPEDGNANLLRWVAYCADAEFDALYREGIKEHGDFYREMVQDVKHSRYTQESISPRVMQRLKRSPERRYLSRAWRALEAEVRLLQNEEVSRPQAIVSSLMNLHYAWPGIPWLFDSLERVVTSFLLGGIPQPTESAAYYLEQHTLMLHRRVIR